MVVLVECCGVGGGVCSLCHVGGSGRNGAAGDGGVRPISCMYTKCRLCADIRYRKGKLVLPKGKEAHLLIEGGWGNILMHPDTSVGARNEVKLYE